jgi:hypothetical protein
MLQAVYIAGEMLLYDVTAIHYVPDTGHLVGDCGTSSQQLASCMITVVIICNFDLLVYSPVLYEKNERQFSTGLVSVYSDRPAYRLKP